MEAAAGKTFVRVSVHSSGIRVQRGLRIEPQTRGNYIPRNRTILATERNTYSGLKRPRTGKVRYINGTTKGDETSLTLDINISMKELRNIK